MQTIDSIEISTRFSTAWSIATTKRGSKNKFFEKYGIDKRNFYRARRERDKHNIDASWIAALVIEFEVSADWILTGRGDMIENNKTCKIPEIIKMTKE